MAFFNHVQGAQRGGSIRSKFVRRNEFRRIYSGRRTQGRKANGRSMSVMRWSDKASSTNESGQTSVPYKMHGGKQKSGYAKHAKRSLTIADGWKNEKIYMHITQSR